MRSLLTGDNADKDGRDGEDEEEAVDPSQSLVDALVFLRLERVNHYISFIKFAS